MSIQDDLKTEAGRTKPDYYVYIPKSLDGSTPDGLNEHFLVFEGPDGSLMTVWTQSPMATGLPGGRQHNRIVFSRSDDDGETWEPPRIVIGPSGTDSDTPMASWGFPMVSKTGRIYVVCTRNTGSQGWIKMHTGLMDCVYSDDAGRTWSEPQRVPFPHTAFDDPNGIVPPEWIVWQLPMRDLSGGHFTGYSHWLHPEVATLGPDEVRGWTWIESVVEFMRFTNIDSDPEPRNLTIEFSAHGEEALRVPHYIHPECSVAQEPSIVRLPDQRLFCVMRSCSGMVWWSQSGDDGATWSNPRPLLYRDAGRPLLNSVGCDPIYRLADGRFIILYHNHRGFTDDRSASEARPRQPVYCSLGAYRPDGDQPVWFSDPKVLLDTDYHWVDGNRYENGSGKNLSLSMYSSFTARGGKNVLWYPDRKFFLLGKIITDEFLNNLTVPD